MLSQGENEELSNAVVGGSPSPPTVVVVEDNTTVMVFLELALTHLGYHVVGFEDAESATAALAQPTKPGFALVDCNLGNRMTGIQFIEHASIHHPDIPLIGMSGEHWKGTAMLNAGASGFLPKPISLESLTEEVLFLPS